MAAGGCWQSYGSDGNRVKSILGSVTTAFVGEYLEWTGSTSTMVKYYLAGSAKVAVRTGTGTGTSGLKLLVGDHLGSTSMTLDAATLAATTQRYRPWGEAYYSSASLPAKYTFTGQYSYTDDFATPGVTEGFGLMYYRARWYDPYLNRFTQPDSIVPEASQGTQAWDRYAYVNNNPVRYNDPTGHSEDCGLGDANCHAGKLEPVQLIMERYQWLEKQRTDNVIKSDVEALAQLADYAASLTPDCTDCFVRNMGAVLTGIDSNTPHQDYVEYTEGKRNLNEAFYEARKSGTISQEGYPWIFRDPEGSGDQARHFWFWVQVEYEEGALWSEAGNFVHETRDEWASFNDWALGEEATTLGIKLANGLPPLGVGNQIRINLSPDSSGQTLWRVLYKLTDWAR